MGKYLDRYRDGEHVQVWRELLGLGNRVRREAVFSDAVAVAEEMVNRAKSNIERLIPRLERIGYQFGQAGEDRWDWEPLLTRFKLPADGICNQIDSLEAEFGPLPLSLRAWYGGVGQVSFLGFHPKWPKMVSDRPPLDQPPLLLDPLCVLPLDPRLIEADWEARSHRVAWYQGKDGQSGLRPTPRHTWDLTCRPYITISVDADYKACQSGGPPYEVQFPCPDVDASILYLPDTRDELYPYTFVEYLRRSFAWGGFPGFEACPEAERPSEDIAYLTEGLSPI